MSIMPNNLWQFLMTFDAGERFPLAVVIIVFGTMLLIAIVAIVAGTIRSIHRHRLDDALKRELVERGMDAEEIERIVGAKRGGSVNVRVNQQLGGKR